MRFVVLLQDAGVCEGFAACLTTIRTFISMGSVEDDDEDKGIL